MPTSADVVPAAFLAGLRTFQSLHEVPVTDSATEAPVQALYSLREAAKKAPANYSDYLDEAVRCYEGGMYRAAVLMVWAAVVEHLYSTIEGQKGGIREFERANFGRYGTASNYKKIKKRDDFLYLREAQFIVLAEDAGLYNRNARTLLEEKLVLRNRCGHPTLYKPGREETVIFIESLLTNIVGGTMLHW
jgi:hypothetical protein